MSPDTHPEPATAVSATPERASDAMLVHPATGEVLDLATAPTTTLAEWRAAVGDLKWELDGVVARVDSEVAARLDFEGKRSAKVGEWEVTVQAPTFATYEVEMLGIALESLVCDGRISRGAAERCIKAEVKRSAVQRELNKLLAHVDPEVREAIARCRSEVTRTHRLVAVKRRGA